MSAEIQDTRVVPGADQEQEQQLGAGLGYCLACLTEYKSAPAKSRAPWPRPGITLAPAQIALGGAIAVVAVPTCWDHLTVPAQQPGPALIRAQGNLPGHR